MNEFYILITCWYYAGFLGMFQLLMMFNTIPKKNKMKLLKIFLSPLGGFITMYIAFKKTKENK